MTPRVFQPLTIGDLTAPLPIIQGGMGVAISLSGLSSAVAEEGGIGTIASVGIGQLEPDVYANFVEANARALRKEIRKARQLTRGLLAVNIMVAMTNYAEMVKVSLEEEVDLIISGAGLPLDMPRHRRQETRTKLVPIVSSARAAGILCKRWLDKFQYAPDALVVEGPLAGGHLGFRREEIDDPAFALERLIPQVVAEARRWEERAEKAIPVIAAGGIWSGADILRFQKLGAAGVQMATRFVTTEECDASEAFKQTYIAAAEKDIAIIKSPVGLPGRAIRNAFVDAMEAGEKEPFKCPYHCIATCDYTTAPYCIALALVNAQRGRFTHGFAFAGANAHRAERISTVHETVEALEAEYSEALEAEAASRRAAAVP